MRRFPLACLRRSLGLALFSGLAMWQSPVGFTEDSKTAKSVGRSDAEARIYGDISYLASDELKGRSAETPGLKVASEFIAQRFKELGLQTDLFDGTPFQVFELTGSPGAVPEKNNLKLTKPDGASVSLSLGEQFQPQSLGSNGLFDAPIVFAGYGITANDGAIQYDDYADLDVKGKVVLVIRKEPQGNDPKSLFNGAEPSQYAFFNSKVTNAAKHGAAALILFNDAASESASPGTLLPVSGSGIAPAEDKLPTLFASRSIVESWLAEYGKSLTEIETEIDKDLKPRSFEMTGWKASGQTEIARLKIPSMNVLGYLPGKGDLAEEIVIVGAHFDHVGMGGAGSLAPGTFEIHNGADDNASGTVGMLEVAKRLTERAKEPSDDSSRRGILFMAFSAEELGLIGSEYYVNHPRFALDKTVAMLNLDMVGRISNNLLTVYGTGTAKGFDELLTEANEIGQFEIKRQPEGVGPSDHQSFFMKGIPVYHFFSGFHPDYHRPSDDFDKINVNGIARIADMVTFMTDKIARAPERPSFLRSTTSKVRLGVRIRQSEPGLVVDRVMPGGWAKKAGILPDDQILKIGAQPVVAREDMDEALSKFKPGDMLEVEVKRGEENVVIRGEIGG
jgi:hypothetical protein